jgi:hypothetical protein
MEAEEAKALRCHGLQDGGPTLISACRQLMQKFPADVAMGVPLQEYLRLVSPANQTLRCVTLILSQMCELGGPVGAQ